MQERPLDIGVIGCGKIAQAKHLPYLQKLPRQFRVRALSDRDPQALMAAHNRYPSASAYPSHEQLLEKPLDAVLIATNGNHLTELLAATAKSCHVFVEKPLCLNVRDAELALSAVNRAGTTAMVGYMKRYAPSVRWALDRFREEENKRFVQCSVWQPPEDRYLDAVLGEFPRRTGKLLDYLHHRVAEQEIATGMDEDFGSSMPLENRVAYMLLASSIVHDINLLFCLLGEPVEVLNSSVWNDGLAGNTLLVFRDTVVVSLTWVFLAAGSYHERFNLVAERERIEIDFPSPYPHNIPISVVVDGVGPSGALNSCHVDVSCEDPFELELKAFHAAVCQGAADITSFEEATRDLYLIREIIRAASPISFEGGGKTEL